MRQPPEKPLPDSLTRSLLEPLLVWRAAGAGPEVLLAARSLLADHIAVAAWGSQSAFARIMRERCVADLAGDRGPELPFFGSGRRCSAVAAAMANAVAA